MKQKLYQALASAVQARLNCIKTNNDVWLLKHTDRIKQLVKDNMPSGAGIDSGTKIDLDASKPNRLVFDFGYHHMNENGMYDGWTEHRAIVTPDLTFGFNLKITGKDRNQIKDYLADTYDYALGLDVENA